jgi:Tol biopolymer transport system component
VSDRTGAPQVYLINLEDLQERQLTDLPGGACQPEWSPDGRQLLFVSPCPLGARKDELYPDAAIYVLDVDSDNLSFEPLIALLGGAFDPDWSEGGIVFTVLESNDPLNTQPRIYLADALGQPLRRLSGPNADDSQPTWSPDGGRIAFRNTSREEWDSLYWMNADGSFDGSRPGQLTFNVNVSSPAWSPDGVSLAFINRDRQRLFLVQFDNVSIGARLIFTEFPLRDPAWSPDGGWLAVEYWPDGNHDIWLIMPADPGQKQRLTSDPAEDYQPAWRP